MADLGLRCRLSPIPGHTSRDTIRRNIYLPALLGEFTLEEEGAHVDYETVRDGEYSVPRFGEKRTQRLLRTTDLEALTLYWPASWLHPSLQDPDAIERALYRILRSREPVEILLRIHQIGWDDTIARFNATFRGISMTVKPGEADTKYWTIRIKEWRAAGIERRGRAPSKHKLPTTHKLDEDDTLESLANRYYGSKAGWRTIAAENGLKKWGAETPLVKHSRYKEGSRIKIPRKPPIAHVRPPSRRPRRSTGGVAAP